METLQILLGATSCFLICEYFRFKYETRKPIDMILFCPQCQVHHIDEPESEDPASWLGAQRWTNPPHKTHLCHSCGNKWKPSHHPTNGVRFL